MSIIQQLSTTFCNQSESMDDSVHVLHCFVIGDTILSSGGFITLTPVQVYCIQRRLQIPIEACCKLPSFFPPRFYFVL